MSELLNCYGFLGFCFDSFEVVGAEGVGEVSISIKSDLVSPGFVRPSNFSGIVIAFTMRLD